MLVLPICLSKVRPGYERVSSVSTVPEDLADTRNNDVRQRKITDTESLKAAAEKSATLANEDNGLLQRNFRFVAAGTSIAGSSSGSTRSR